MQETSKLKIDSVMVMISVSVRCRSKTLHIRISFRVHLWKKPNLQRTDTGAEGTTEGRKQNRNKSKSWKIGEIKYRQNITCWNCNQKGHFQNQCSKLVASRDKEVNMAARDSDDALVCCVENTVEDRIMDSGASFHATYCKEELERFKLHSGKVRLADDKTLDIAGVEDVVLKTSFGTSWTLKDVRYISSLKRRLISVGQLDKEGYHVGFEDQQWKVIKGSFMVARENKRGSLYMVEVHPEGIDAIIDGSGSAALWFGEAKEAFLHNVKEDKEIAEIRAIGVVFGVAERLSQTFRAESTRLRVEALKMLWADSRCLRKNERMAHEIYIHRKAVRMKCDSRLLGLRRCHQNESSGMVLVDILENLVENDSIVAEHGLSSEITQSPGRSSYMSEGSENSRSFEDSRRSNKEDSKDRASSKEGGSETPPSDYEQERRHHKYCGCSRLKKSIMTGKGTRLLVVNGFHNRNGRVDYNEIFFQLEVFEMKDRCSEKQVLSYVLTVGVTTVEWERWENEEPCSDVHQVGDEREVEVLRSFNWPPSELIMEDGVLPERGYSQFNDVSSGYLVSKVS
ncbi:retrovirus-related pol polyprotein from transposon TNT 1-94 [Tanacetum coccineum]